MRVNVRNVDDVIIVDLAGRLVAGVGDELLRDVINELLSEGWKKILLNLSEVSYMDSAGLGELLASHRTARNLGARMITTSLAQRTKRVLRLSQILPLIEVHDTEQEALETFRLGVEHTPTREIDPLNEEDVDRDDETTPAS